jgi:hypothetical protein
MFVGRTRDDLFLISIILEQKILRIPYSTVPIINSLSTSLVKQTLATINTIATSMFTLITDFT